LTAGSSLFLIALLKYGVPALMVIGLVGVYVYVRWYK
jgi:hypothetical protein